MERQLCLNCGIGFLVMSCENFVEETCVCEGCDTSHCCRECGSYNTRPKTKQEKLDEMREMKANPERMLSDPSALSTSAVTAASNSHRASVRHT